MKQLFDNLGDANAVGIYVSKIYNLRLKNL